MTPAKGCPVCRTFSVVNGVCTKCPPADGHRDGQTYDPALDYERLNTQMKRVWNVLRDRQWHTLHEIAGLTGDPEASISARIRDVRKPKFGGHNVDERRVSQGLHEYRLVS